MALGAALANGGVWIGTPSPCSVATEAETTIPAGMCEEETGDIRRNPMHGMTPTSDVEQPRPISTAAGASATLVGSSGIMEGTAPFGGWPSEGIAEGGDYSGPRSPRS